MFLLKDQSPFERSNGDMLFKGNPMFSLLQVSTIRNFNVQEEAAGIKTMFHIPVNRISPVKCR